MKEIRLAELVAAGYREDKAAASRLERPYNVAMIIGICGFIGGFVLFGRKTMGALGLSLFGLSWVWMIVVIMTRYLTSPRDPSTGEKLEKYRARQIDSPNEEVLLVNHAKKTYCRRVVTRNYDPRIAG